MDVWGDIYKAQFSGHSAAHEIERDDGRIETFESASNYFNAPRTESERELLGCLEGPVLDLAAGAGSYTLYLQSRGLVVTAAEHSAGAMEVCRACGCQQVVPSTTVRSHLPPGVFGSIIVMGNTLGAHQAPETLPGLLRMLRNGVRPGGRLLFTMIDPLDTTDAGHLEYQRQNRARSRPPGLIRMRIAYQVQQCGRRVDASMDAHRGRGFKHHLRDGLASDRPTPRRALAHSTLPEQSQLTTACSRRRPARS
jgi:SAM-dependent methyltransferase